MVNRQCHAGVNLLTFFPQIKHASKIWYKVTLLRVEANQTCKGDVKMSHH